MINALLTKIGNLFEKEFLFGSFLPALIFAAASVATVAGILGFEASLSWAANRGPLDKMLYPLVASVAVIVFAYVLSGIRPLVLRFWSGETGPFHRGPIGNVMKSMARKDFLERREATLEQDRWTTIADWLQEKSLPKWESGATMAKQEDLNAISRALSGLSPGAKRADVEQLVSEAFLSKLDVFSGSSLSPVYEHLKRLFLDWRAQEQHRFGTIHWALDRSYGSLQQIRATRLGNLIESYTSYSFTRYGIEPDVFWPHLQTQIDEKFKDAITDARALLDFALNLATLSFIYFFLCVFAGPWLDWSTIWIGLAAAGAVAAVAGYRIALIAADQFGGLFRAAFDLYRLKLLAALRRKPPARIEEERDMWREISQRVVYGRSANFDLSTETPVAAAGVTP